MRDPLAALARSLGCTRGQAATIAIGFVIAVPTLVSTVIGVQHVASPPAQHQEQP